MGPPGARTISQEAFDELVKENIHDLGMDPHEALQDAIQTLTLQGVDLSGVVKCIPGESNVQANPIIQLTNELKSIVTSLETSNSKALSCEDENARKLIELLNKLCELCSVAGSENATVAARNGGVEALSRLCSSLDFKLERALALALKALSLIVCDLQSSESFRQCGGLKTVIDILHGAPNSLDIRANAFSVISSASTGNEVVKESFMELKVDVLLVESVKEESNYNMPSLYDAVRVLLTPDDGRVAASQVFGYARTFAKIGMADALVDALRKGLGSSCLTSACAALKAVAVNDEICKSISENGGIDIILQYIDESGLQGNRAIAKSCCSLLSKLAGSDANKIAIVQKGGIEKLIILSLKFSDDPSVIQEVMSIITALSLRLPENAARAMDAGVGDLTIRSMQKFPTSHQMQRQSCLMIRNLVVRNPENRTILLNGGIEKLIRRTKGMQGCKDAATAALRDLGLDDYNV
ncbi:Armadillo repeat-containing protein 6 [Rhynchospora pubera]|uniref:Armadillo repeat-containing protein 6 n=1 Tax=Rhynchospora pubera TaxID=906938 RepID=A0AAV8DCQ8_9POAL|nr:Armadillo repeat-containing protein 6 [Rhynchospora pubera]